MRLLVGDGLQAELERPLQREITKRYEWLIAGESFNLLERTPEGTQPVLQRRVTQEGTALVVMDRDFVLTEGTYKRFTEFLEHEGAVELAREVKDVASDTKLRRRYARNLKALVRVGAGDDTRLHARQVGQELEVLLLDDPWSVKPDEELTVQILFSGKPLEGLQVKGFVDSGDGSIAELKARTDAIGTVRFPLKQQGTWVIRATVVRPCADPELADWDTYYATFSFHLPIKSEP